MWGVVVELISETRWGAPDSRGLPQACQKVRRGTQFLGKPKRHTKFRRSHAQRMNYSLSTPTPTAQRDWIWGKRTVCNDG